MVEKKRQIRKLQEQEKVLRKRIELSQKMIALTSDIHSGKIKSTHQKIRTLFVEIVWLQKVKKEMPELLCELEKFGVLDPISVPVRVEEGKCDGQLTLPGMDGFIEKTSIKNRKLFAMLFFEKTHFIKNHNGITMVEMLRLHDKTTLSDFNRYLRLPVSGGANQKKLAQQIAENICEQPLHLLPCLSDSAAQVLFLTDAMEEEMELVVDEDNVDDFQELFMWGLLTLEIVKRDDLLYMALDIPEEVKKHVLPMLYHLKEKGMEGREIAGYLEEGKNYTLEKLYSCYDHMLIQIKNILTMYGSLEENSIYSIYQDLTGTDCGQDDFLRFIFLRGTFYKEWITGQNQLTKQRYISLSADILEHTIKYGEKQITNYYPYQNFQELEHALQDKLDLWKPVRTLLSHWDIDPDELEDCIVQYHMMISCGESLSFVMECIAEHFELEDVVDIACLWRAFVTIFLESPCYTLKGYSRLQAEMAFGLERYHDMFEEQPVHRIAKAMIYNLPVDLQQQLAELVFLSRKGTIEKLREKEKQVEGRYRLNPVVKTVLTMNVVEAYSRLSPKEQREKEEETSHRVVEWCQNAKNTVEREQMLDWCGNMGLPVIYNKKNSRKSKKILVGDEESNFYYWDEMEPAGKTVVKKDKIYPNAPCPCGGGKKYKQCCGRK